MTDTSALRAVLDKTAGIVAGVADDQLGDPTPCPEFTVGRLRGHIVGWSQMFAAAAAEQQPPRDPEAYDGTDPAADFRAAADQAVAGFDRLADDAPVSLMSGSTPASAVVDMMTGEYLAHGWDLAVATGQQVPYSSQDADAAMAMTALLAPEYRGQGMPFGEIVPTADDASPLEKFLGFSGRDPQWPS
jgi:uncharacterized protein (TIGR03086 family)